MSIKNTIEDLVNQEIDTVLSMYPDCCSCDKCKDDIMAIALNNISPKYVSTRKGDLFARIASMTPSYKVFISQEIAKAIQIVHQMPRHEED